MFFLNDSHSLSSSPLQFPVFSIPSSYFSRSHLLKIISERIGKRQQTCRDRFEHQILSIKDPMKKTILYFLSFLICFFLFFSQKISSRYLQSFLSLLFLFSPGVTWRVKGRQKSLIVIENANVWVFGLFSEKWKKPKKNKITEKKKIRKSWSSFGKGSSIWPRLKMLKMCFSFSLVIQRMRENEKSDEEEEAKKEEREGTRGEGGGGNEKWEGLNGANKHHSKS